MSKISTYEVAPVPKLSDKLIGTSVGGEIEDITYNFTLLELLELFLPVIPANNLQGVLDYGNTATQDINLFGTITTTNLEVTDTANLFITYLNEETHIVGSLFDSADSVGTAGQVLTSTGEGVEWFTLPPIFTPNLQQVLEEGNTADLDIILDADLEAINITADTANIATQLSIQGTVVDYNESAGTSGQVLESTSTGVQWVNLPVYSATSPLLFDSGTNTFSIQVANSTQGGYLTANDWVTFDGKQNAGAYITALTGEATATGPGSVPITLNNASVIAKVLTGLNITGGSISATDSILTAFGKVQNQINGLMGGVQYQGVWNAATNTPTLTSSVGTQGHYYIVNVAGTTNLNGITDWQVGDWAIFSGGAWQKVDNTDSVTSVNGQTGAVSLTTDNIPEGTTNLYFLDSRARAAVSATSPLSYNNTTGVFSIQQASGTQNGYLSSTDWTTFNNKQNYLSGTGLVKSTAGTITYITDNSSNWNTAYNRSIISASVTGTGTKTLTLNEQDGNTITASWSDADTGLTSVGLTMPSAFSVANSPLTSNGTIGVTGAGTTAQYIRGDGSLATFPSIISEAQNLVTEVYNSSGATLTKGTVVYINGGQGNLPTITKAIATGDATSAQTYGVVRSDITNMNNGYVVVTGRLADLDTRDYTPGQQLYLSSTTAGAWTPTKQYAPAHLVYVAIVVRAHPTQGVVEVMIQNGYEMDELHNVAAQNPDNNDILQFKTSTNLWTKVAGTTTNIAEGTNLYYLDSRARAALSFTPGSGAYNSTTGVITIPTNTNQLTNGAAFITLGSLSSLAPLSYNNTTGVFSISQAGTSTDGYLSSTDWNTFNNKQPAGSYVPTSRLLSINGTQYDLSADRSWSVGTVTSVAALTLGTSGTDLSSSVATGTTTPVITLNVPTASAANRGALSAADWSTFNTKVGGVTASSPLASSGGSTPNITIQQASGSQDGYLSSTDWTTFNNKQAAGNYITSLTGEATASGPGAAAVTLNNASVTAKVLTGVNITGGSISATDSILTAFGKVQNQINGLVGGSIYQGTWNAATNTPALASGVGTKGYYYIVSVAGTTNLDGITDWFVGDWAIFDGTAWQQVDNTDAVVSVNGQTGAVSLTTDNIPEGSTNQYFLNSRARAALSFTAGSGAYNSTTGVITIPTNTSQLTNGANFITLASLSGTAPIVYSNTTGAISITQAGIASNGFLSSTDWNTFNNKAPSVSGGYLALSGGVMTGQIVLKEGTNSTDYTKGLRFPNDPYGGSGDTSGLRLYAETTTGAEAQVLELYVTNDVPGSSVDRINFAAPNNDLVTVNGNKIWNSGNLPTPQSAITLTTTGTSGAATLVGTTLNIPQYQSVLTNPVTGTGTTNYLAKFTGTSTIGNSLVFDNGTNVGIGTASPNASYRATISGAASGVIGGLAIVDTDGASYSIYSATNNLVVRDVTNSATRLTLDASGNFGIGSSPIARLTVVGTGSYNVLNETLASDAVIWSSEMTNDQYNSILQLVSVRQSLTTGSASNGFLGFSTVDDSNAQGIRDAGRIAIVNESPSARNSATALSFWTNAGGTNTTAATEKVRITSGGNVGIGIINPVYPISVHKVGSNVFSTVYNVGQFTDGASTFKGINLGYDSTSQTGVIYAETGAAASNIAFWNYNGSSWGERMRLTSGGDLLIGDTTASANLWVKSSAPGNTFGARNTNATFAATVGFFGADRNTTNNSFYYIDCYNYGSGTYRFRVADNGNVTSAGSGLFSSNLQTNGVLTIGNQFVAGNYILQITPSTTTAVSLQGILAGVGAANIVMQASGGNVGIGTTSPQLKLDIQSGSLGVYHNTASSGGAQLYLGDMNFAGGAYATSAPGIGAVFSSATSVAGDLAFYTYGGVANSRNEVMRIRSGNVGIGTTAPNAKLNIQDGFVNVGSSANVTTANTLLAGYGYILSGTTYGNVKITSSYSNATNQAGLEFYTDNGTSTERMRITSGGLVNILSTSTNTTFTSGGTLGIKNSAGDPYISWHANDGSRIGYLQMQGSGLAGLSVDVNQPLAFYTNAQERMRITSGGNVGIGTTSPNDLLHINGSGIIKMRITGSVESQLRLDGPYGQITSVNGDLYYTIESASGSQIFRTGSSTERMRITSSGTVLVNTTSSSDAKFIADGDSSAYAAYIRQSSIYAGSYRMMRWFANGNVVMDIGSSNGIDISFSNNQNGFIAWSTNGSERMRITNAGNVGVNISNPATVFNINKDFSAGSTQRDFLRLTASQPGAWFSQMGLQFRWNDFGNGAAWNLASVDGQVDGWSGSNGGGALVFYTKTLGPYATDPTEKMRINAAGALCLGTTTPYGTNLLNVNGSVYATGQMAAVISSDVDMFTFVNTGASYTKSCFVGSIAAAGSTSSYYFYGQQSTSVVSLKIFTNGNIQNTNNSYGAISDARLKENIIDATPKLEDLMKVKVRNYNLKGESTKQIGVISQELEEIFPNMIEESTNIGENVKIKGVKYSVFVPMLIKAIQEQQEQINYLKSKIQ